MMYSYSDDQIVDPYVGWPEIDVLAASTVIPLGQGRGRMLPLRRGQRLKKPVVVNVPRLKKVKPETPVDQRRYCQPLRPQCALHRVVLQLGSQAELVRRLGMKSSQGSTVRWWVSKGSVPAKWIHKVAKVGIVSVSELVADWPFQCAPSYPGGKNRTKGKTMGVKLCQACREVRFEGGLSWCDAHQQGYPDVVQCVRFQPESEPVPISVHAEDGTNQPWNRDCFCC